jgi:putative ABC transport system permease protein
LSYQLLPIHLFFIAMSFLKLLVRFLEQRLFASVLTAISIAVGVALTLTILTLRLESERAFSQRDTGFEIIVGAKGSPLQLVLNTMYHVGTPVGNFPLADYVRLKTDKRVRFTLPMVFGDNVGGFKVIGTTTDFFTTFEYRKGIKPTLAAGSAFDGDFKAVLGAEAAQTLRVNISDSIAVRHGLSEGEEGAHDHGKMPVVGILARTGTAIDKGVYMTMHTVWDTHYDEYCEAQADAEAALAAETAKAEGRTPDKATTEHDHDDSAHEEQTIPAEFTTITAIAVRLKSPVFYDSFMRTVNDGTAAQAAVPIREIMGLFAIVGNVNGVLLGISYLVIVVGAIGIVVAMYNSLNERRREIAILRSLGAHRRTVLGLMLAEASSCACAGGIVGWGIARVGLRVATPVVERFIGTNLSLAAVYPFDGIVLVSVIALAAFVAALPAWKAYRVNVAENLAPLS